MSIYISMNVQLSSLKLIKTIYSYNNLYDPCLFLWQYDDLELHELILYICMKIIEFYHIVKLILIQVLYKHQRFSALCSYQLLCFCKYIV